MWGACAPVGRAAATGGYRRLPFAGAEVELRHWFAEAAAARGLALAADPFGNLVAWWRPEGPDGARPGVLTGSHLDSVVDGGAFDGPLGVVSALAAVDRLRERGVVPARPLGVAVLAAEEGSRFPVACLGSRLATGALPWERARELRDADGTALPDAMAAAGLDPSAAEAGAGSDVADPDRVACFLELHVEQGRDLVDRGAAVGAASGIWPHGRYRFDFTGRADHAGTTRMEDRRDPMLTYAMTALAANKQARVAGQRATFGRVEVAPNGTNAVPSRVTGWMDARADSEAGLAELVDAVVRLGSDRAGRDGTALDVVPESVQAAVAFDADLTARLAGPRGWPVVPTAAGHDAGVLAEAGVPTAMLFVRNPTGVSHAPDEHAEVADCLAGVAALADCLQELVS